MTEPVIDTTSRPPRPPEFHFGVDLGMASDYTALAVVEKVWTDPETWQLNVRDARRFPLRTPYPTIAQAVKAIVEHPAGRPIVDLAPRVTHATGRPVASVERVRSPRARVVIDSTGVGEGVCELFLAADIDADLIPLRITGGATASRQQWPGRPALECWNVAKQQLVAALVAALQTKRLWFSAEMGERDTLIGELAAFTAKTTPAGNETFSALREGQHDDLVLALCIAVWIAAKPRHGNRIMAGADPLRGYRGMKSGDLPYGRPRGHRPTRGKR